MRYDSLLKQAIDFDFSAEYAPPPEIMGDVPLGNGLIYLAEKFGLPEIVGRVGGAFLDGQTVSFADAREAEKQLARFYYRPEFRAQHKDSLPEFGAIKQKLFRLLGDAG